MVVAEKARHVDVDGVVDDVRVKERSNAMPRLGAIVVVVWVLERVGGVTFSLMNNNNYQQRS